jgi:hypothetical protein
MRAPASIMPLAALFLSFLAFPARSSPWPLEALRWGVGGETMTTPGGAGTLCKRTDNFLRARRIGFYHGAGALTSGPSLCPAPMPQALSWPPGVRGHNTRNTRRYGHPLAGDSVPSGPGLC